MEFPGYVFFPSSNSVINKNIFNGSTFGKKKNTYHGRIQETLGKSPWFPLQIFPAKVSWEFSNSVPRVPWQRSSRKPPGVDRTVATCGALSEGSRVDRRRVITIELEFFFPYGFFSVFLFIQQKSHLPLLTLDMHFIHHSIPTPTS